MKRHISYLKYIIRHKFYVYKAGRKIGVSRLRLLSHDMSKFLPCEWFPYAMTFYKFDGSKQYVETEEFNFAWLHHQHNNKHHWQHWMLREDSGNIILLPMPIECAREMVADWAGAGMAITGKWEVSDWYKKNRETIQLHESTRDFVEKTLYLHFGYQSDGLAMEIAA